MFRLKTLAASFAACLSLSMLSIDVAQACRYYDNNANVIDGTSGSDCIYAGGGNDVVTAKAGVDSVYGESGNDTIYGKDGDDNLYGGDGNDTIEGGDGQDDIYGGTGNDYLYGNTYGDTIYGGDGDDYLYGGDGDDYLCGENGSDLNDGGNGTDSYCANQRTTEECPDVEIIVNFAEDGMMDRLELGGVRLRELQLDRDGEHLLIGTRECPALFMVEGWERGAAWQHLELELRDGHLDVEALLSR